MNQSIQYFFAPGKLLLSSEYVVLDGALALAVPTQIGQEAQVETIADNKAIIFWEAYHQNQLWLKAEIRYETWEITTTNLPDAAQFVVKVLQSCERLSKAQFQNKNSYLIKTNLQFPAHYGLGSSSTLMSILADWANVCPFELNAMALGGSGYDIAVAQEKSAILFSNQPAISIEKIHFNPEFTHELIFIHLNQKQNSREGIQLYRSKKKDTTTIDTFTKLTEQILNAKDLNSFSMLMEQHESLLSQFLGLQTVKELHFQDCPVFVKSLGAWGGDFVLTRKFSGFKPYFSERGFQDIWEWKDLIG